LPLASANGHVEYKTAGLKPCSLFMLVFLRAKAQKEIDAQVRHMNVTAKDKALNEPIGY